MANEDVDDTVDTDNDEVEDTDEDLDTPATHDDGRPFTKKDLAELNEVVKKMREFDRKRRLESKKPKTETKPEGNEVEVAVKAEREAWEGRYVKAEARRALAEAGFVGNSDAVARAVRSFDMQSLEVDDDGDVVGLDDEIEAYKELFPMQFGGNKDTKSPTNGRKVVRDKDAAGKGNAEKTPMSGAEALVAGAYGRSRR